jgi:hypothetical protein
MNILSNPLRVKLQRRKILAIDPGNGPAVKRSVHEIEIATDADTFASALRQVLAQGDGALGPIDIKRLPERVGREFAVGERFHGCVRIARIAARIAPGSWSGELLHLLGESRFGEWIEDQLMSDYAEVIEVGPRRVVYRYLEGTPLSGSSTLIVDPLATDRCRFQVIFEYQERGGLAIDALHRFGLQMHDQVTWIQAARAAALTGAEIVSSTIPIAYRG